VVKAYHVTLIKKLKKEILVSLINIYYNKL
jgi:hypothetical protein